MSATVISWLLALFLLGNVAWAAWQVFRTTDGQATLIINAAINVVVTFALAHAVNLHWASVVPVWLWWATAVLLAVYLGGLAYRLLTRPPVRSPTDG